MSRTISSGKCNARDENNYSCLVEISLLSVLFSFSFFFFVVVVVVLFGFAFHFHGKKMNQNIRKDLRRSLIRNEHFSPPDLVKSFLS